MNDDQLIENLRALADRTPEVTVDRDRVLALGHRRRTRRTVAGVGGTGLLCAGLVAGGLAWAGTSSAPRPDPLPAAPEVSTSPSPSASPGWEVYPPSPDDGEHAVVDHEAGTIRFPEDDWVLTAREQAVVDTAEQYLHVTCLEDLGYGDEVEFVGAVPVRDERLRGYGLWSREDLALDYDAVIDRGAYWYGWADDPAHLNDTSIPGDNAPVADDPDAGERWQDCADAATERIEGMTHDEFLATGWGRGTSTGRPEGTLELSGYRTASSRKDLAPSMRKVARQAVAVVEEWEQCLAAEGLEPAEAQALVPDGMLDFEGAYTPEQQEALADLAEVRAAAIDRASTEAGSDAFFVDEESIMEEFLALGYTEDDLAFQDEPAPRPLLVGSAAERARVVEVDVRCKQTLGTVQRLADLDAAVQVRYIADNPAYFESRHEIGDRMLTNANKVLDEAGVVVP
jgi:hypothetical protein